MADLSATMLKEEVEIRLIRWQDTIFLRHKVLWPEALHKCYLEEDSYSFHFGMFLKRELVAVASVIPDGDRFFLRMFSVKHLHQRKGLGRKLFKFIVDYLENNDNHDEEKLRIILWGISRVGAEEFYEKLGFKREGGVYEKDGHKKYRLKLYLVPRSKK